MKKRVLVISMAALMATCASPFTEAAQGETQAHTEAETESETDLETLLKKIEELESENAALKKQIEGDEQDTEAGELDLYSPEEETETTDAGETYTDATTTRLVQQALNSAGYDCGTPDGVAGSKTAAAINAYEEEKGITVNGIITDELLNTLGIADTVKAKLEKEASKGEYSSDYSYEQLARNPDAYMMDKIKLSGEVLQAYVGGDTGVIRLAMNNDYSTVVYITYDSDLIDYRILEDDQLTVYGVCYGLYSYEAISGATITIPWVEADIIELN